MFINASHLAFDIPITPWRVAPGIMIINQTDTFIEGNARDASEIDCEKGLTLSECAAQRMFVRPLP